MMSVPYAMPETPSFFKRPWVWVVLVTLLSAGGMLAVYLSRQIGDRDWWRREATAYNARHAVPDDENAAVFYQTLVSLGWPMDFRNWSRNDWNLPTATSDLALLSGHERILAALQEATRLTTCFYPFNATTANDAPFDVPWLNQVMTASRLLVLEARRQAGEGRPEESARTLRAIARLGFQHERGFFNSQGAGGACCRQAFEGMERLAMDAPPSPGTLEALAAELQARAARRPSLAEFWEAERIFGRGSLEYLYRPGLTQDDLQRNLPTARFRPSPVVGTLGWGMLALRYPLDRCRDEFDEVYDLLAKEDRTPTETARIRKISTQGSRLARTLLPPSEMIEAAEASRLHDIALERGTRILLLLRACRLKRGIYPGSLEALRTSTSVEIPGDPYTDRPFLYRKTGDGFLLYSAGPNGKDDGGLVDGRDAMGKPGPADLIFGRPPKP